MSAIIKSLFIASIDASLNAEYIMEVFYCLDIATIKRVTLVPFSTKSGIFKRAYIDIHEWHPTEGAYNFIQRLKDPNREARIVHHIDEWWVVDVNKNPTITTKKKMEQFTTINYLVVDVSEPNWLPWLLSGDDTEEENNWDEFDKKHSECMIVY